MNALRMIRHYVPAFPQQLHQEERRFIDGKLAYIIWRTRQGFVAEVYGADGKVSARRMADSVEDGARWALSILRGGL